MTEGNRRPTVDELKAAVDGHLEAGARPSSHDPVHPDSDRECDYCGGTDGRMGRLGFRTVSTPAGRRHENIWGHLDGCPGEEG